MDCSQQASVQVLTIWLLTEIGFDTPQRGLTEQDVDILGFRMRKCQVC